MLACVLFYAVWCFRDTHFVIVHGDLIPTFTEVARTVVIVVLTIVNNYVADVVLLSLSEFANLVEFSAGFSVLYFAVEDFRTALVIGDFNVFSLAVEALSRALLVYAVWYGSDTHVRIVCKELPVEACQTGPVAFVVVAVGDGRDTAAIRN